MNKHKIIVGSTKYRMTNLNCKITLSTLENIKNETCIIVTNINNNTTYKQINKLKKDFSNIIVVDKSNIEESLLESLLENLIPSYIVVENGKLIEMGNIIY